MPATTELRSLLLADFDAEVAATRRMLGAFPLARGDWRPHEKSRTLAALATHVASLPKQGVRVLAQEGLDIAGRQPTTAIATSDAPLAQFEANIEVFRQALVTLDEATLAEPWTLRMGARVLARAPRAAMLRLLFLSHLVHHRAQLGVYYRLLGVPVPGMYGPSADEQVGP